MFTNTFATMSDFLDAASKDASIPDRSSRKVSYSSWSGTRTWEEALDVARHGWPEGTSRVQAIAAQIGVARAKRPIVVHDVVGDTVDVPAYLAGIPNCMTRWEEGEEYTTGGKIVRIVLNASVSAGVGQDAIFQRGAAVVALSDLLEQSGRSVEITLACGVENAGQKHETYITLKRPDLPLSPDVLTFAACHPAMLRRMLFSLWESIPEIRSGFRCYTGGSYGHPSEVSQRGDIYIGSAYLPALDWANPATVETWIKSQLAACGVTILTN